MASKAEIIDKYGVVQHMLNIARHNRKEEAAKADANVDRVLAMLRLKDNVALKGPGDGPGVDSRRWRPRWAPCPPTAWSSSWRARTAPPSP